MGSVKRAKTDSPMSPLSAVSRRINVLELNARVDQMERKHVEMQLKYDDMERRYSQLRDEHNNEKFGSMARIAPVYAKAEEALSLMKQGQTEMKAFQKRYSAKFTEWKNKWSEMTRLLGSLQHMNTPSGRRHFERVALFAHNIGRTVHGLCNETTQLQARCPTRRRFSSSGFGATHSAGRTEGETRSTTTGRKGTSACRAGTWTGSYATRRSTKSSDRPNCRVKRRTRL